MRLIWARRKASPQGAVDRMHFVALDFLKLVTAAVLCGVAVSITVAGIALLLAGDANAATRIGAIRNDAHATPGTLLISGACEGYAMEALERDWLVRIDGNKIDVRVIQTWSLPTSFEGIATFAVALPTGANLKTLSAQTPNREVGARMITQHEYERMRPADYLQRTRDQLLAINAQDGSIRTSPIPGLARGDTVVIQYTYVVDASSTENARDDVRSLNLLLLANDDAVIATEEVNVARDHVPTPTRRPATPGTVWVEWTGKKPSAIVGAPRTTEIDHGISGIDGLNWHTPAIQSGEKFTVSWKA